MSRYATGVFLIQIHHNKMVQPVARKAIHKLFNEINLTKLNYPFVNIRHRPFLPGSESKNFPKFLTKKPTENQLKVVQINKSVLSETHKEDIGKICYEFFMENIRHTPAILIKGLPIQSVEDFTAFTNYVNFEKFEYNGGTGFRERFAESIYAASDEPACFTIEPHYELFYIKEPNRKILFCCLEASNIGGENPIVFSDDLMKCLDKSVLDKFKRKHVRYVGTVPHEKHSDHVTWQGAFMTKSEKVAEERMRSLDMNWKWNQDGSLLTWTILPAFHKHPYSDEMIWLNQAIPSHYTYHLAQPQFKNHSTKKPHEYLFHTTYGDGEEIEDDVIDYIRSVAWSNAVPMKLEKGDVMLLDNYRVQHSRMGYEGKRKLVVQLIK